MKVLGVRPLTYESSKPPKYISCSRTVEFQALTQEVISYKKRLIAFHTHVSGRWWQATLGRDLLRERPRFPEGGRGYHGHDG
jgi:hypothetical protein